jgi:hypothetical protein
VTEALPDPEGARAALARLLIFLRASEAHHAADQRGMVWEPVRDLIIAPTVGGDLADADYHNNYQDPEAFLLAGGRRGRQHMPLTDGTYFFAMRNPSEAVRVLIKRIWITPSFIGTPASSRSVYVLQRATGAFTGTGGSTLTPVKRLTSAADSVVVEARAGGALTMSSITPASTQFIFGHLTQLLEPPVTLLDLQSTPIVLAANEGLTLRASGAIVSGSSVMLHIEWAEVAA